MSEDDEPKAKIGHNSANKLIKQVVDRVTKLEEEKAGLSADVSAVYAEAKAKGLNPKILRKVVKASKMDATAREEEQDVFDLYCHSLGWLE